ncbi:hypothetical protein V6N12_011776 [Hibiscus sabdariffa]|uniref:Uncharacterized protein n=1 Tax=Hibiscus sabdariffa TaxID=183260 RepID=A0ABR2BTE8_9ROSI
MDAAGLQGFELVWVAASMVLPSFTTADLCDSLLASKDFWSTCFYAVVFQEAELDRDPTVENQEEFESEMGISPTSCGTRVLVGQWGHDLSLDVVMGHYAARDHPDGGHGGNLNAANLLVSNGCALSSPSAVVGVVGAALVPVLGSVPDGLRKVKSVKFLVEALASPEQI